MPILSSDDPEFDTLCEALAANERAGQNENAWPNKQLELFAEFGVFSWFVPREFGGTEWSPGELLRGYHRLANCCLTPTFVLTQWASGCRRIAIATFDVLKEELLPALASGKHFTTIAVSHLTTSRRHLGNPAMRVTVAEGGFLFDGFSPWVTGANHAQTIVLGGEFLDGRQLLVALPRQLPGVRVEPARDLMALGGSCTGEIRCEGVFLPERNVLHGPVRNVMAMGQGAGTGGLQTTALALGLVFTAIDFLAQESRARTDLTTAANQLTAEANALRTELFQVGDGCGESSHNDSPNDLRARANSLVLRSTQAALVAAKGAGYLNGHPVGRWCREALFFLVWSCPQSVLHVNLCELAGLES